MPDTNPARPASSAKPGGSELALRTTSALLLSLLAAGSAYVGGWAFIAFWGLAAILVFWEWTTLVAAADRRAANAEVHSGLEPDDAVPEHGGD